MFFSAGAFQNLRICSLNGMTNHLDRVEIRISPNLVHQSLNCMRRCIISGIVSTHTISNDKQIRKISNRVFGNKHIVLVHLPLLPYIRS